MAAIVARVVGRFAHEDRPWGVAVACSLVLVASCTRGDDLTTKLTTTDGRRTDY